jgi:hypothetical protein
MAENYNWGNIFKIRHHFVTSSEYWTELKMYKHVKGDVIKQVLQCKINIATS